ncbi:MAG: hypothetical protein JWM79_1005 [Nocardioides sp.]|nr:hypothetical protein [Nocardioides sp.]
MYALWGSDLSSALHAETLRTKLADAGATRLQLNIDDEHVTRAMRIPTFEEPIGAIVTVWTDGRPGDVTAALSPSADRIEGWRVEERKRLDPPETYDGRRADALANVAVIRKPSELSQQEWMHRWMVDHTPIAIRTQATFGYIQNVAGDPVTPDAPYVSAFVEELFPSAGMDDMHAFYGSGGSDEELNRRLNELMASVARIGADHDIDLVPTSRYLYDLT